MFNFGPQIYFSFIVSGGKKWHLLPPQLFLAAVWVSLSSLNPITNQASTKFPIYRDRENNQSVFLICNIWK
jgi:hypothetical protein